MESEQPVLGTTYRAGPRSVVVLIADNGLTAGMPVEDSSTPTEVISIVRTVFQRDRFGRVIGGQRDQVVTGSSELTYAGSFLRFLQTKFVCLSPQLTSLNKRSFMTTEDLAEPKIASLPLVPKGSMRASELLRQYGCGPIPFVGTENAFYERHLIFDRVIDPKVATARERFEAFAHSVRDALAQRWVLTKKTYERENPKRIYYLSMEFLIGRSAANNVTNLLLDPLIQQAEKERGSTGSACYRDLASPHFRFPALPLISKEVRWVGPNNFPKKSERCFGLSSHTSEGIAISGP